MTKRIVSNGAPTGPALATRALACRVFQLVMLVLLSAFSLNGLAKDQDPVFSSHVTDLAAVMGAQAGAVDRKLKAFEATTGHQVFVLTVQTTGSRSIDEYAVEVFKKWKIGRAKVDDGVLLVIAVADRKMRIEVGYGLEGTLTDARCSRIIHDVVAPQFARGEYNAGIEAGVDAILSTLAPSPPLDLPAATSPANAPDADAPVTRHSTGGDPIVAAAVVIVLGIFIGSLWSGFLGLFVIGTFTLVLSNAFYPGAQGGQLAAAIIATWLCGRWFLIEQNVREYHLARSTNHLFTWLWVFLAPGSGRPLEKGERPFFTFSFSFGSSGSSSRSSSDDSDCGGSGGRSGGAGASGGW